MHWEKPHTTFDSRTASQKSKNLHSDLDGRPAVNSLEEKEFVEKETYKTYGFPQFLSI